jgi:hypothetical protein
MDDAAIVRGLERLGDLPGDGQCLALRQPAALAAPARRHPLRQRGALDQFQHQKPQAVGVVEPVDRADVGMIQRGEHPRLALEACETMGVAGEERRQHLDGDITAQCRVACPVDLAHAAGADQRVKGVPPKRAARERSASGGRPLIGAGLQTREPAVVGGLGKQRLHFAAQPLVVRAGGGQPRRALARRPGSGGVVQGLDLGPAFGRHDGRRVRAGSVAGEAC